MTILSRPNQPETQSGAVELASLIKKGIAHLEAALSRDALWYSAVALLAVMQIALIFMHRPWADELQALLIAREATSQTQLLEWLRYEGHPPAWYWLLQAISAAAPQSLVLPIAALLCAMVVQGVILFAAPFTRFEKLCLALSPYILFEFLTIARGTSLGVAIIFAMLALWRGRLVWPLLALLPMVDFLFGVLSGVFVILKWRERDLWWPGVGLWLAGGLLAAWTVIPAPDMVSANDAMQMISGPMVWFMKMGSLPLPFQGGTAPQWNTPVTPIAPIAWVVMIWLCWELTRTNVWHRLMIFGFFAFTLAFSLAVYPIGLRHIMLGALLLIALHWLARSEGADQSLAFSIWLAVLALFGIGVGAVSTQRGFDSADQLVAEINRQGLEDKTWIAAPEWRAPAIAGRSDIAFIRPAENCTFRFVRWDHEPLELRSRSAFEAVLSQHIALHGKSYLLSDKQFEGFDKALIEELAFVPAGYDGIEYFLYVVGKDQAETLVSLPRCYESAPELASAQPLGKK